MMLAGMMIATLAGQVVVAPVGTKVKPADQCFVIERAGKPIGRTRQVIRPVRLEGRRAWDVVVHQRIDAMNFDMRDHFVLARADLTPIAFDNSRSGVTHVRLRYADGRVTGTRVDKDATTTIDLAVPRPVWDGNLWGVTFGALPLKDGATFVLPYYQYDKGLARFTLTVSGSEDVVTPTGTVPAWKVEMVEGASAKATYLIAKATGAELGSRAGPFTTRLGGDCSGLD